MSSPQQAKVLIAGGSIAGLVLANMLERSGIDYLVLEKYNTVAPNLGASIAIVPNGARILDQLGCYGAINALFDGKDGVETIAMKDEFCQTVLQVKRASERLKKNLGYAFGFIDRQMLVQILYDNLRDKSKILTGKGVETVEHYPDRVRVHTTDGTIFTGEILVGADGIYSTVRQQMWRIADQVQPGHFPLADRINVPTDYCCIFGISKPNNKFPNHSFHTVMGRGYSYIVAGGPNHRIHWFLFKKLSKTVYGMHKVPRYTDSERDALAAEHGEDYLNNELQFGELYASRMTATLQALPELVFSKWHYGRIITIGDAAHKFNPIGAQGGMNAIEDAAVLSNQLVKLMSTATTVGPWSDTDISQAFEQTFSLRYDRAVSLMKKSQDMQRLQAKDGVFMGAVAKYVIPWFGPESFLNMVNTITRPAPRLEMLPLPNRPHDAIFDDERPIKPKDSMIPRFAAYGVFTLLSAIALYQPDPRNVWYLLRGGSALSGA